MEFKYLYFESRRKVWKIQSDRCSKLASALEQPSVGIAFATREDAANAHGKYGVSQRFRALTELVIPFLPVHIRKRLQTYLETKHADACRVCPIYLHRCAEHTVTARTPSHM